MTPRAIIGQPADLPGKRDLAGKADTIKDALDHPPRRVDVVTVLVSLSSSLTLAIKTLYEVGKDGRFTFTAMSLVLFCLGTVGAVLTAVATFQTWKKTDVTNERAKEYVTVLMDAQERARSTGKSPAAGSAP